MYSIIELREIPLKNYAVNIDRDAIIGGWYGTIKQIYRWAIAQKKQYPEARIYVRIGDKEIFL